MFAMACLGSFIAGMIVAALLLVMPGLYEESRHK